MDNYCNQCGNPLNGKHQCEKCGHINGGTFNIISDKVKGYDYKGKAEELKAKANETIDKAKSYDYRSETENIKKGGIKYFWNKHRKLSICALCFVVVLCVSLCFANDNEKKTTHRTKTDTNIYYSDTYSKNVQNETSDNLRKEIIYCKTTGCSNRVQNSGDYCNKHKCKNCNNEVLSDGMCLRCLKDFINRTIKNISN